MDSSKINRKFKTQRVKKAKKLKASSSKWLQRQLNDPYFLEAKERGYRSRAAFKIIEINEKFKVFKKGLRVLDLGSAPGGWSQMVIDIVGKNNICAVDILEMEEIEGVKFLQQDFLQENAEKNILALSENKKFDIVMSDMAANTTGDQKTDHLKTMNLLDESLRFSLKVLKFKGAFIAKIFKGGTENSILTILKKNFKDIKHFKPDSSRKDSVEMYVVATGFTGDLKDKQ